VAADRHRDDRRADVDRRGRRADRIRAGLN
jgi:hypothetical protein